MCFCLCAADSELDTLYSDQSIQESPSKDDDYYNIPDDEKYDGFSPGFRFSNYNSKSKQMEYEGIVICLLSVTAFICLIVWVLKSNFEERQQVKMRREASIRDRGSFRGLAEQMQQA